MAQTAKSLYLLFKSQIKKPPIALQTLKSPAASRAAVVLPIFNLLFCNDLHLLRKVMSPISAGIAFFSSMGYTEDVIGLNEAPQGGRGTRQVVLISLIVLLMATGAWSAQVRPGAPTVEENHYLVPCIAHETGNEVAALDFHLMYDPALFQPLAVEPGPAALQAGKMVTANLAEPGRYIVVMMGLNQTTITDGVVARVMLLRIGESPDGMTTLAVAQPTLSSWEGKELPAQGGMVRVPVKRPETSTEGESDNATDGKTPGNGTTPVDAEINAVTGPLPEGISSEPKRLPTATGYGDGEKKAALEGIDGFSGEIAVLRKDAGAYQMDAPETDRKIESASNDGGARVDNTGLDSSPGDSTSSLTIEQDTLGDVDISFVTSATSEAPTAPGITRQKNAFYSQMRWWTLPLIAFSAVGLLWFLRFRLFR